MSPKFATIAGSILTRYGLAVVAAAAAVGLLAILFPSVVPDTPYITLFPTMAIVAITLGTGPGLLAALVGLGMVEHFILPAHGGPWTLSLSIRATVFLVTCGYVGWISHRLRQLTATADAQARAAGIAENDLQKFVSLADQSSEFVGMCDMAFMPFYVNEAGRRLVGFESLEEAKRTPVEEFFFPEDRQFIREEFFARVLRDGSAKTEVRFRHFRTGEPIWMIYDVFYIRDAEGKPIGLATVSHDITERNRVADELQRVNGELRQANEDLDRARIAALNLMEDAIESQTQAEHAFAALRESREDLNRAQAVAHVGSWRLNIQRDELVWSDENWRIFGVAPRTPLTYDTFLSTVHPDDRASVDENWKAALEGRPYDIEHRILVDGQEKWVRERAVIEFESDGTLRGGFGTTQDVTERKQAERALSVSRRRAELLAETAGRLLAAEDPQRIVEDLCREVMSFLDCHAFFNYLVEDPPGRLHLNACAGIPSDEVRRIEWLDFGVAVCGCVAQAGRCIVAENIATTPDVRTDLVRSYGIQAYCCHPLMANNRLIGTLSFGTRSRPCFSADDTALMKAVSALVTTAMDRVQHQEALKRLNETLERRVEERTSDLQNTVGRLRAEINEREKVEQALRRSEDELRCSEARFRLIAENATDMVLTGTIGNIQDWLAAPAPNRSPLHADNFLDQWRFTFVSPSVKRILGYNIDEAIRLKPNDMLTDASLATFRETLAAEFEMERNEESDPFRQQIVELTHLTKDGQQLDCEVTLGLLRDDDGNVAGVVGSVRDITPRKDLEREVLSAVVREKTQIGQQLHDALAQEILGLGLIAKCLTKTLEAEGHEEAGTAREIVQLAISANDRVRAMIKGIRPVEVAADGLVAALGDLAESTERLTNMRCTLDCPSPIVINDDLATNQLFLIAQESVRNAIKHSGAKEIVIRLTADGQCLALSVQDDGDGMPAENGSTDGMGLRIMRYRAATISGNLSVETVNGHGTRVSCVLPWERLS